MARYRVIYAENFPGKLSNRPRYHLQNFARYLHLEKLQQLERVPPELAERNWGEMEAIIDKFMVISPLWAEEPSLGIC